VEGDTGRDACGLRVYGKRRLVWLRQKETCPGAEGTEAVWRVGTAPVVVNHGLEGK